MAINLPSVQIIKVTRYLLVCPLCERRLRDIHNGEAYFSSRITDYKTIDCTNCGNKLSIPDILPMESK